MDLAKINGSVNFKYGKSDAMYSLKDKFNNGTFIFTTDTKRLYLKFNDEIIGITPSKEELEYRAKITPILCPCCGHPLKVSNASSLATCEYCNTTSDIDSLYYKEIIKTIDNKDKENANNG